MIPAMGIEYCKLYDENLVQNIMLSTGLVVFEYLKKHTDANLDNVYDIIDEHAQRIIADTIKEMNIYGEAESGQYDEEL